MLSTKGATQGRPASGRAASLLPPRRRRRRSGTGAPPRPAPPPRHLWRRQGRDGRPAGTCLPIGRDWPRLEAALSLTWRWRGVPEHRRRASSLKPLGGWCPHTPAPPHSSVASAPRLPGKTACRLSVYSATRTCLIRARAGSGTLLPSHETESMCLCVDRVWPHSVPGVRSRLTEWAGCVDWGGARVGWAGWAGWAGDRLLGTRAHRPAARCGQRGQPRWRGQVEQHAVDQFALAHLVRRAAASATWAAAAATQGCSCCHVGLKLAPTHVPPHERQKTNPDPEP